MNIVSFPKPTFSVWGMVYLGLVASVVWGSFFYGHFGDPVMFWNLIAFGTVATILFIWEGVLYLLTIPTIQQMTRSRIIRWRVARFRHQYGRPSMPWDILAADEIRLLTTKD